MQREYTVECVKNIDTVVNNITTRRLVQISNTWGHYSVELG
jgi:hypothetical protein